MFTDRLHNLSHGGKMRKLDEGQARRIERLCEQSPTVKIPYAVRKETQLVLVNRHFLVAWPLELVDLGSNEVRRIIGRSRMEKPDTVKRLEGEAWSKIIAPDKTRYMDAEEVDPTDAERAMMFEDKKHPNPCMIFGVEGARFSYHVPYWQIVTEACSGAISVKVYVTGEELSTLIIYEDGIKVGAIANTILGDSTNAPADT
jgi:hypothetical protein